MTTQFVLVISDCEDGREAEYSDYYDNRHIPDIMTHQPEAVSAQRYAVKRHLGPDGVPRWRFSTLYTVETDDIDGYLQRSFALMKDGKIPPSGASVTTTAVVFSLDPLGPPITRESITAKIR